MGKRAVDDGHTLLVVAARKGWSDHWWGKEKGRAGRHGLEWGDVCGRCQRPRVRADGSGANSGRMDGARLHRLHGKVAECRGS